ncbi:efflux RND transporter permease subunit [Thermodesulfobacteriota bacterium]
MKGVISWFAENHVAANLLMIFLLLAGVITGLSIKKEVFPESSLDKISITVLYPGASPAEVEEAVVRRIEENVAGLAGIKQIDSKANEGRASVTIEVMKDWDLKELLDEVKAEVDRITTFPEEAEKPIIREVIRQVFVVMLALYGDAPESTIKRLAQKIKDDITNLPEVTLAEVRGTREEEIHIEISEGTLNRYGLTLNRIADAVKRASMDLPAGSIKTTGSEILIRTKGRRYYASEYQDIAVITNPDGSKVTLGQIADLRDGFEDSDRHSLFNGKPTATIMVYRVADQSALIVAKAVRQYVDKIKDTLPEGLNLSISRDMSEMLQSRLELLLKNMGLGLLLVVIILGLFMNARLAFWITLGIPISFMTGLWLLPWLDVSINMMSLFAFIMVLGIVVDDAIIVGESVFRKHEEGGLSPIKASEEGTVLVAKPVIFAVLTTVVAFWPLLLGTGRMGTVLRHLPIVIILVLFGSLVESLLILPAHLARSKSAVTAHKNGKKIVTRLLNWFIRRPYTGLLNLCIRWRYITASLAIAILLLTLGIWQGGWIKFTFFPRVEGNDMMCTVTMPSGMPIERTKEVVSYLERVGRELLIEEDKKRPEGSPSLFESSNTVVGSKGGRGPSSGSYEVGEHLGQIIISLIEGGKRDRSTIELANLWREKAGIIPDAESLSFSGIMFSPGNPIEVHLSLDDNDALVKAAEELKKELRGLPGVFDVADSFLPGKKEMQLKLKPEARSLGLTLNDLAMQVRHAFYGAEALRLQRGQDEVKVMVRYPESERKSLGHIEDMRIRTSDGSAVPFSQVAEVTIDRGYTSIERSQRLRVIKVTSDVNESVTNANEVRAALEGGYLTGLQSRYPGLRYTIEGEGKSQKESMVDVMKGFSIAIFCIYALLAIPFRSFSQPLIIMAAIPFGIVGAVAGHLIMGFNLSLISLFGMVGLAGVVVNDSLVLIHATNRIRNNGSDAREAITAATALRFRAILLTSVTTFGGLTPMLLETDLQAKFLVPMAVSLGFGVLFATGITLLLIPCGYMILEDIHRLLAILRNSPITDRDSSPQVSKP